MVPGVLSLQLANPNSEDLEMSPFYTQVHAQDLASSMICTHILHIYSDNLYGYLNYKNNWFWNIFHASTTKKNLKQTHASVLQGAQHISSLLVNPSQSVVTIKL